jgi:hypothetical protein
MNELKDASVFVLKMILIIGGFFMVFFSKVGYYIILLGFTAGFSCIQHFFFNLSFWTNFRNTIICNTLLFEIIYPRFANFTKSTSLEVKVEYDKAKAELNRRRSEIDNV